MLENLREVVRGGVLLPGDEGFDAARRPWNLAIEQNVLAVVEAADADDVAALVRYARDQGLRIAAQPGGHGATGSASGTILLRTTRLDEVSVDPVRRTARVGVGVKSAAVTAAAAEHGLVAKPGSSPIVSVAGYTLGGGLGWFARKYGLSSAYVNDFEFVDADGNGGHANADENVDLYYALAGGGGDYAIVTAMELALHHEPELFGGTIAWPAALAAEVFAAFREVTANAPLELTLWAAVAQLPGGAPAMVLVSAAFLGSEAEGRDLLKRFDAIDGALFDSRSALSPTELGAITNDPVDPGPTVSRAELLDRLDDDVVATLLAGPIAPLLAVQVRHLGGRLPDQDLGAHGPHGAIDEPYLVYMVGLALTPEMAAAVAAKQAEVAASLGDAVTGRKPLTFLNPTETLGSAFSPKVVEILRETKEGRDPQGVFVSNYPVGEESQPRR